MAATALSYVGTPFGHRGRDPGRELDCIGIAVCAYRENGVPIADDQSYRVDPDQELLLDMLRRNGFRRTPVPQVGAVVAMRYARGDRLPRHSGVVVPGGRMVHVLRRVSGLAGYVESVSLVTSGWGRQVDGYFVRAG